MAFRGEPESLPTSLPVQVLQVLPVEVFRIAEHRGSLFERHAVLLTVLQGFRAIPGEHIYVYTIIAGAGQGIG